MSVAEDWEKAVITASSKNADYSFAILFCMDYGSPSTFYCAHVSQDSKISALINRPTFDNKFRRRIVRLRIGTEGRVRRYHVFHRVERCKYH
jgi:hypothetical protein